ncbi:SGNH/GDSL hydrolase family protein [Paenibacillus sp. strain BS8-2]
MLKEQPIVLFQGDSITDGNRGRDEDPSHILGHGYPYLIAAKLGFEMAERRPIFMNKGVSGNRVADLYARWNEDAMNLRPDLISILIGVNDVQWALNSVSDRFERSYRHLIEETKSELPDTGLILCEPFILREEDRWAGWRKQIKEYQNTVRRLAEQYQAVYVPLQEAFSDACLKADPAYWLWDGVHPTAAGHQLIAREWLSVVQNSPLRIT